jgi:phosphatidate cytidylyltransferase
MHLHANNLIVGFNMDTFIKRSITGFFLLISFLGIFFYAPLIIFSLLLCCIATIILLYELPVLTMQTTCMQTIALYAYVVIPFSCMIFLNQLSEQRILLCIAFLAAAAFDMGAYCIGNLWGKNPLAPSISPAKTIEGLMGGYVCCFLFLWIVTQQLLQNNTSLPALVLLTIFLGSLAFIGDLFESMLKRRAKIKDSGSLLPGHGGLLDRFDSSMATTVGIYITKTYVIQFFR